MNRISRQLLKIANEVNMLDDKNLYKDILQLLKNRMLNDIQCPNINGFKILGQCRSGIQNQSVQCGVDFNYYYNYNAQPTNPSIIVKIFVNGFNNKLYYQAEINYFSFPQIDSNSYFARTRQVYRQYIDQDDSVQNCINLVIKSINQYLYHPHMISCLQNASPFKDRRVPYNSYR